MLPEPRRRLEAICARRSLRYTAHGTLAVNFMDEANLDRHKAVCRANLELAAAVGATVLVHHPGLVPAAAAAELDRLHAIERAAWREMGDVAGRSAFASRSRRCSWRPSRNTRADPVRLAAEIRAVGPSACRRHARRQPQLPDDQLSRHLVHRGDRGLRAGDRAISICTIPSAARRGP